MKQHGLSPDKMIEISNEQLSELISEVPLKARATDHVKQISNMVKNKFRNDVPKTKKEIINDLKFSECYANLVMYHCWRQITGKNFTNSFNSNFK